jgi:hypothetical protein
MVTQNDVRGLGVVNDEFVSSYLHRSISQPMTRNRKAEFRVLENFFGREEAIKRFQEK